MRSAPGVAGLPEEQVQQVSAQAFDVDPDWRRRGIARRLVQEVVDAVRGAGHRRLWVIGNQHALAFYLAVGFVQTDEVPTALGTGLRMCLDLSRT